MHPEHVLFMARMFLTHRSTKNMPPPISTQTHVRNIDNATTFITQLSKKFGVMKLSMWMIYTMVQLITKFHILVARMYVNSMTV